MSNLNTLFKNIPIVEPERGLESRIFQSIALERRWQVIRKVLTIYAGVGGSSVALVLAVFSYGRVVMESDFWNLIQLIFSDATVITSHWSSFAFSLLEAFPASAIAILLAPIFTLMLSLVFYAEAIGWNNQHHYV